ncbi:hypothetical protein SAMN06265795_109135 [Noviherbaspirillum humi]|uniref:Lipoprotein n=1 Tax=Noviherbaspirillum humi TaxID=1688639 RepID=A0A239IJL8_9BURK|nr:hypothetical protein [Noviherbaspirillum humi]SNS93602.1 hypothetical protein SAMN06265795_109135 [Noviherbaspirillum humi]
MRKFIVIFLCFALNGCAAVQFSKGNDLWSQKDKMVGMPVEQLLACAGTPMQVTANANKSAHMFYGVEQIMSGAGSYCVVDFQVDNLLVSKITHRSNNPGGLSTGEYACAFVIDSCIGDGKLADIPIPGTSIRRLKGNPEEATQAAQARGEKSRNEGIVSIFTMMAAPPTNILQLATQTVPDFVNPDDKANILQQLQQLQQMQVAQTSAQIQSGTAKVQKPLPRPPGQTPAVPGSQSTPVQRTPPTITAYEPTITVGGASATETSKAASCPRPGNTIAGIQDNVGCRCRSEQPKGKFMFTPDGAACVLNGRYLFGCKLSSSGEAVCTAS